MLQNIVRSVGLVLARRALPAPGARRIAARGIREPVEVVRDRHGIPHIFAGSARDLFFAQGFVHAEDRLFQMDLVRRAAAGRLSEVLGDAPVDWRLQGSQFRGLRLPDLDFYLRALGMRRAALASLPLLGGEAREALEAYADGVNAGIAALGARRLPLEMKLLGYRPEPWTPADSVSIGKALALELTFSLRMKLCFTALAGRLAGSERLLAELMPEGYPAGAPRITALAAGAGLGKPPRCTLEAAGERASEMLRADGQFRSFLGWGGGHLGSNWLIVGAERSTTGKPLLENDPHLGLQAQALFHLCHLRGGPYDVVGGAVPGAPGVVLGRNRRVAWAFTNAMIDDTDLYAETVRPDEPGQYLAGDRWEKFRITEEEIGVKGERRPRRRTLRVSRHGPIISDALPGATGGPALALRWTAQDGSREVDALLAINRASSWPAFVAACRHFDAPAQNMGYADVDGNIGYYLAGRIPIRSNRRSLLPADGARGEGEWAGDVPFEEHPHVLNPKEGFLASANNKPVDDAYPYYISAFFDAPYRARRLCAIVAEKGRLSPEAMEKVPLDVYSIQAEEMVKLLVRPIEDRLKRASGDVQVALNYLLNWDYRCTPDSIAASIFHVFYAEVLRGVFAPALGEELFLQFTEVWNEHCLAVEAVLANPKSAWFEGEGRARDDLVAAAFERAVAELVARLGKPTQAWGWGRLHRLVLRHPFHGLAIARRLFDLGPFETGGSGTTLNCGQWRPTMPFEQTGGAALRHVCNLAEPAASRLALAGGQSANPASPHAQDLVRLWLEGRTVAVPMDREAIEGEETLVLVPE
jgi:penicillin amidase